MNLHRPALALLLALIASATFAAPDRKFVNAPRSTTRANLPFSDGVVVGDTLYIGGHIGLDPKTDMAASDPKVEAKIVMDGVKATVETAGFKMEDVVSIQVFCTDLALYSTFNEVYRTYFTGDFPARAFIGAGSLLRGGHFEVLGVAIRRNDSRQ